MGKRKIQIIGIVSKEIEVDEYLLVTGNKTEYDYRLKKEKAIFEDEPIGMNLFVMNTKVM